ncbi:MAG: hypothetical protein COU46_03175 [Candidatus Niyogibacteria bacterium CG10_big_fil_rev_8_21_14_0_10_42_19]|uniref:Ribulose-phosphate 3-epimerase n=1 Tax=Candidatus Niyogibacteria bacterium CG10_big_fil_rev_8_21_14_0_10_42_19 TaxID=1974725 RepID=A0A2H0TEY6_9BACT|nr:MAG: hypothetical protein COU46_03175 [Candidatus Niyogibacteria bacterium CG10_big_fil_rev_8_21_14_0_10_42_19]
MSEIIPAINVENIDDLKNKIKLIEPYAKRVHIDVADGTFTPNTLWHQARDLMNIETSLEFEVHLMITDVSRRIQEWMLGNVKKITFHLEAESEDAHVLLKHIKDGGKEAGLGILPNTPWEVLGPYAKEADSFLLLAVNPGFSGQKMRENTVDKISRLHASYPNFVIGVDGGVNAETAKSLADAGANYLMAASAIFGQNDIKKALDNLNALVKSA